MCGTVTSQLVGDETTRCLPLTLQQLPKEPPCRTPVPMGLDKDIDHISVLIYRTPEILALPIDRHEDLVQIPCVAQATLAAFQTTGVLGAELHGPLSDRFISYVHSAFGEQILNFPIAETESIIEPDRMTDDLWWKAMPDVAGLTTLHPTIVRRDDLT